MACGGCGKGGRHTSGLGDLSKFAYLTPRQLRLLQAQLDAEKKKQEEKDK